MTENHPYNKGVETVYIVEKYSHIRLKRLSLLLSIGLLLLVACQTPAPAGSTPPIAPATRSPLTSSPIPIVTAEPTSLPTSAPTETGLPASTPVASATPLPTSNAVVSMTPQPTSTPMATTSDVYVNSDNSLNLRADANTSAAVLRTLAAGAHLTAIGPATSPDTSGIAWQNVRTDDGQLGWVAAGYLTGTASVPVPAAQSTPAATSNLKPGYVYVSSTAGLNLRADHTSSSAILATLADGQRLQTNGLQFGPDAEGIIWLNVKTDNNIEGWVSANFVNATVPSVATAQPPANVSDAVNELLRRTNTLRGQNGLPPYALDAALSNMALLHSQYMSQNGITHIDGSGLGPAKRLALQGFTGQLTESIFGGQASIDDAWSFWSTDPPHLANLLNSVDTIIGIGVVQVGLATYYTQDFAMPPAP